MQLIYSDNVNYDVHNFKTLMNINAQNYITFFYQNNNMCIASFMIIIPRLDGLVASVSTSHDGTCRSLVRTLLGSYQSPL